MTSLETQPCLVCGEETKNRCSSCAMAGIDLFFCSKEHQKLVWKTHRQLEALADKPFVIPAAVLARLPASYKKQILTRGKASVRRMLENMFRDRPGSSELEEIVANAQSTDSGPYTRQRHDDLMTVRAGTWLALQEHGRAMAALCSSEFNYAAQLEFQLKAFTVNWLILPADVHTGFLHRALVVSTLLKLEAMAPPAQPLFSRALVPSAFQQLIAHLQPHIRFGSQIDAYNFLVTLRNEGFHAHQLTVEFEVDVDSGRLTRFKCS
ncbi:hypothetical protein JCM10449v2_003546 [Rhodotorula kratochvilovae]